ncbi:MAG: Mur ligase family protein [Candidatus Paceibacterota bacterium]
MIPTLAFFWFIRTTKAVMFWIYLWQLKEYHIGRFIDHFRTEKGRSLFLNFSNVLKIILFIYFFALPLLFFFVVFLIYIAESAKTAWDLFKKRIKKPVLTKKTVLLIFSGLFVEISSLLLIYLNAKDVYWFAFWLLVFDVLCPFMVSLVVLLLQPFAVFGRNRIIRKARLKREGFKNLLVIGITGSYGKTSTKEFLYSILSSKFKVLKTEAHQNSEVGISQCILDNLKLEHEIFIVEMGAYNRGGIKLLCSIAKPKIGVLTGINEQHMATFGSQENIINGKYELVESLPADGVAFFNAKNKYCVELYNKTQIKKFLYGEAAKFMGEEDILGAVAVAKELGMSEEEISHARDKIENKFPGIQVKKGINGLNIIDATYSANPDGVISNLEYLKSFSGRKVIIMPCLIELGKSSKDIHKRIGVKIGEVCDLAIITTKDRLKEIKEGAGSRVLFMENPKEIFEKIKSFCKEGDVILLESRVRNSLESTQRLIKMLEK